MSTEFMRRGYFDWMHSIVTNDNQCNTDYDNLLEYLFHKEFEYRHPMDANRLEDGINLRYRYGREHGYSQVEVANLLDDTPCTVLEMMVALAIRCEESIMSDDELGDRTSKWFWDMIHSLGLENMHGGYFNENFCNLVIRKFINREYCYDGKGSLFTVKNPNKDMRSIDIWYQMCMYLNEYVR